MRKLFYAAVLACSAAVAQTPVEVVPGEPQIFVDDALVAAKSGVTRKMHPAEKLTQPVLVPDRPWEGRRVNLYGTVFRDEKTGQYRMWYGSSLGPGNSDRAPGLRLWQGEGDVVSYALSKDGLYWDKPDLGIYRFDGGLKNNIVFDMHSPSIIYDAKEKDPAKRYKMVGVVKSHGRKDPSIKSGYSAAYSPDGLHWTNHPNNPILPNSDTITLMQHPRTGEYFAFHKKHAKVRGYDRRVVWLSTSKDFVNWSEPELVLAPDEKDDEWATHPPERTEFYNMSAIPYGSHFLGFATEYRVTAVRPPGEIKDRNHSRWDGPVQVQLLHSRDGKQWERNEDRSPIVTRGPGIFDGGMILGVVNTLVADKGLVHLFYCGYNTTHGRPMSEKWATLGRATWREDGFVSLDARDHAGIVETVPLRAAGRYLLVNADAGVGKVRVELLDEKGNALPSYGLKDATPIESNGIRLPARWAGKDTVPQGRAFRVRFHLDNASLFSFRVSSSLPSTEVF